MSYKGNLRSTAHVSKKNRLRFWMLVLTSLLPFSHAQTDCPGVFVGIGTFRTNGNHVQGKSVFWSSDPNRIFWTATFRARLYFIGSSGTVLVATGSTTNAQIAGSDTATTGAVVNLNAALEPRGNGSYQLVVDAGATTQCQGNSQTYPLISVTPRPIQRPTIDTSGINGVLEENGNEKSQCVLKSILSPTRFCVLGATWIWLSGGGQAAGPSSQ